MFTRGEPNDSNCAIILTQEGVVLIDSGNTPVDSQAVMKAVKQLTSQPVRFLIDTEPHTDHTTGHFVFSPPASDHRCCGSQGSRCVKGELQPGSHAEDDGRSRLSGGGGQRLSHDCATNRISAER